MNSNNQLDIWSEISLPSWMMDNINNLQQPSFHVQEQSQNNVLQDKSMENQKRLKQGYSKREGLISYEISCNREQQSQNSEDAQKKQKGSKQIKQKRCENSRKYRERKRQYYKSLQEENKFLKFKVDELTFRMHEMERQLGMYRNKEVQEGSQSYRYLKSQCFKEIEEMIKSNENDVSKLLEYQQKLRSIVAFDGKQKIDLLNYFMSELLENVINDRAFYFMDCLINRRGIHKSEQDSSPLRKIDTEVFQILNFQNKNKDKINILKNKHSSALQLQAKRLQELWKKLYQVYLAILNQGFKMEKIIQYLKMDLLSVVNLVDFLKLQVYFQKIKSRPDIRQLRCSWLKDLQKQRALESFSNQYKPENYSKY